MKANKYIIDKSFFEIEYGRILFDGIPLWNTISKNLDEYEFYINDESHLEFGFVTIYCLDELGDLFAYGNFKDLDECKKWLKNPYPLY